ncbi:hypothetical protein MJO29_016967 [Puccinia striiformis f. sp. tritici]|nr:hypothetical protein MJO29_016967 [Puccinia striiformis f. sp. tritici]
MDHLIDPAFLTDYIPPPPSPSTKSKSPTPPPIRVPMARPKKTAAKKKKTPDPPIQPSPTKKKVDAETETKKENETKKPKPKPKSKAKKEDEDDDSSTRHIWTHKQQVTFLEEIAKAHANGFGTDNANLKKEGWTALTKKMLAKHKFAPTATQIKNQKAFLRRTFMDLKFLRDQSGFGWDEDRSIVTADDTVWTELLEAHPRREFRKLKDKPFLVYDLAYSVFNGKAASGDLAEQEVFPATTDAVKLSAAAKRKAAQLDTSDSDIEVDPISSVQTSTTNTTKRVRDNKNSRQIRDGRYQRRDPLGFSEG